MNEWIRKGVVLTLSVVAFVAFKGESRREELGSNLPTDVAMARSFKVDVRCVGEVEAAKSLTVSSRIRTEPTKIIRIIPDGTTVEEGDVLAVMDPAPFEEKKLEFEHKIAEQLATIETLRKNVEEEEHQGESDERSVLFEIEAAKLELEKLVEGDGPIEESRLRTALQKARVEHEEISQYSDELVLLQEQGFLNPAEVKQAHKKVEEAREAFEIAQVEYECNQKHVFPMRVKQAEASLNKAKLRQESSRKADTLKLEKARAALKAAEEKLEMFRYRMAQMEVLIKHTTIHAPGQGMAVLREQYYEGQRRKPREGDMTHCHQALIDLPDLSHMIVSTKVREVDLHLVQLGKPAAIEVDAYPDQRFTGQVLSIGVLAMADPRPGRNSEKFFQVKIGIANQDQRLRPGMTARVTIHSEEANNTLSIPAQALFTVGDQNYCCIKKWKGYALRPVSTGIHNPYWVEVLSGIKEGDKVCLALPAPVDQIPREGGA